MDTELAHVPGGGHAAERDASSEMAAAPICDRVHGPHREAAALPLLGRGSRGLLDLDAPFGSGPVGFIAGQVLGNDVRQVRAIVVDVLGAFGEDNIAVAPRRRKTLETTP